MPHKFDPHHPERLENPERKNFLNPERVVASLELHPGMVVIDVGCGIGYFTAILAATVGKEGKVFAVDISRELLERAEEKLKAEDAKAKVEFIVSTESAIPLPDQLAEAAFLANVLHEADQQDAFLREIHRLLKPGGILLVVDWKKEETPVGPPVGDHLASDYVVELASRSGFANPIILDVGPYHYAIRLDAIRLDAIT